jgi:hypothetical protein
MMQAHILHGGLGALARVPACTCRRLLCGGALWVHFCSFKYSEYMCSAIDLCHPLTTAIGRSLIAFLEMPAMWQVSTTAVTSL